MERLHELLELPYKVKFNRMNYILRNNPKH